MGEDAARLLGPLGDGTLNFLDREVVEDDVVNLLGWRRGQLVQ